jgi:hypothetical protein
MSLPFQLHQNFFGPVHSWRQEFLEETFQLQLHLNMSYSEVKMLPTRYRRWFIERLVKHFESKNKSNNTNQNTRSDASKFNQFEEMVQKKLGQ